MNAALLILCSLLAHNNISPLKNPVLQREVAYLEVNHVIHATEKYDPITRTHHIEYSVRLIQWIGWNYDCGGALHVDWWRGYRSGLLVDHRDGWYIVYIDGYYVWTQRIEETYTGYDVEVMDQDRYPRDYRIDLYDPERLILGIKERP
jgi:hypothetical protein